MRNYRLKLFIPLLFLAFSAGAAAPWRVAELRERTELTLPAQFDGRSCELLLEAELLQCKGFAVVAEMEGAFRKLPLKRSGDRLRFSPPEKAASLWLYFGGEQSAPAPFDEKDNILATVLKEPKEWQGPGAVVKESGGLSVRSKDGKEAVFTIDRPLPPGAANGPVQVEFGFRSLSPVPFIAVLELNQLDADGKVLPFAAVDPRWLTMATVPGKDILLRENGFLDRRAAGLRVTLKLRNYLDAFDADGNPLPKGTSITPALLLSRLELRSAERLTLGGNNPALFGDGKRGGALRLDGRTGFFFNAHPPCVWSQGRPEADPLEYHWPNGEGTVEFFFRPDGKSRKETTLLTAYHPQQGNLFSLTIHPGRNLLTVKQKDFAGKTTEKSVAAPLSPGERHHLAVSWNAGERRIFLNGKCFSHETGLGFTYGETKDMPANIAFGMPAEILNKEIQTDIWSRTTPATGRVDHLRISRTFRYPAEFTPEAAPSNDRATCALFPFDRDLRGIHGEGDGFVQGGLLSPTPPLPETFRAENQSGSVRNIRRVPEAIPPENRPELVFDLQNYPRLAAPEDFAVSRIPVAEVFVLKPGEERRLALPEKAVMDFIEIRPATGKSLKNPAVLRDGEPDSRSFGGVARGLGLQELDERAKALKLFQYVISKCDYFIVNPAEFPPHSLRQKRTNYDPLTLLNVYLGLDCGPLNFLTMNLFVQAGGLPANMTPGNAHSFEQVFYNGSWHVYDLSAQRFFPSRNKTDAASLEELEADPWLLLPTRPSAFIPRGQRGPGWIPSTSREKFGYSLRPGEAFRYHPYNNGMYMNLHSEWGGPGAVKMGRDVTEKIRSDRPTREVDRIFPEFSTGVLFAAWKEGNPAALFAQIRPDSFVYRVDMPSYPITGMRAVVEPAAAIEYSFDNGKSWSAPEEVLFTGRHGVLVRVKAPLAAVHSFECKTYVQMHTRILTGMLKPGENRLQFLADGDAPARITVQYRKDAAPILLQGGVRFGLKKGCERQLFVLEPGKTLEIPVTGLSREAKAVASPGLDAILKNDVLVLHAKEEAGITLQWVTLRDGGREKSATVLIGKGVLLLTAEQAQRNGKTALRDDFPTPYLAFSGKEDSFSFALPEGVKGNYAFLTLARNPIPGPAREMPTFLYRHPNGTNYPLIRRKNFGSEFYKANFSKPIFRWGFPQLGNYPYMYLDMIALPETRTLPIAANDPAAEFAALLLIPAADRHEAYRAVKFLVCHNYLPGRID